MLCYVMLCYVMLCYVAQVQFYERDRLAFRYDARDNFKRLTELGCTALVPEVPCAPARDVYR